jgi:hypothetical protein
MHNVSNTVAIMSNIWYYIYMPDDVKFSDLFDPSVPRSNRELIESRLAICNKCPWFNKRLAKCKKCGCFMKLKTTLQDAKCPIGEW